MNNNKRGWQVFLPLFYWVLFVLYLYAYRTHQRLSAQTRLVMSVSINGASAETSTTAELDGTSFRNGDRVSIGWSKLTLSHPKAEPFRTNLFIWYGEKNLGDIPLLRTTGKLRVEADPPALHLIIRGPEFQQVLTNSDGMEWSIPADTYTVQAKYARWEQTREVSIAHGRADVVRFAPAFGVLRLASPQKETSFHLFNSNNQVVESGHLPFTIKDLPQANYKLVVERRGNKQEQRVAIEPSKTNQIQIEFNYGSILFETIPPGATVVSSDGREWGHTPLTVSELTLGEWKFTLHQNGYEPVLATVQVSDRQTNVFRTNLVNVAYAKAMKDAHNFMAAGDFTRAFEAATEALQATPNDQPAMKLKTRALGFEKMHSAKIMAQNGNYAAAIKALGQAVEMLPDDKEPQELLDAYRNRMQETAERQQRQQRMMLGHEVFFDFCKNYPEASLFETHELKTSLPLAELKTALFRALAAQPAYRVEQSASKVADSFEIEVVMELSASSVPNGGRRRCLIVGAQIQERETQILFKALEYKTEAANDVPIHPSRLGPLSEKLQIALKEGSADLMTRIRGEIGNRLQQTP